MPWPEVPLTEARDSTPLEGESKDGLYPAGPKDGCQSAAETLLPLLVER